jgi:hypothetical protein
MVDEKDLKTSRNSEYGQNAQLIIVLLFENTLQVPSMNRAPQNHPPLLRKVDTIQADTSRIVRKCKSNATPGYNAQSF